MTKKRIAILFVLCIFAIFSMVSQVYANSEHTNAETVPIKSINSDELSENADKVIETDQKIYDSQMLSNMNIYWGILIGIGIVLIILLIKNPLLIVLQIMIDFFRKKIKNKKVKEFCFFLVKVFGSTLFTLIFTVLYPYFIDKYESSVNIVVVIWICGVILNGICSNYLNGYNKAHRWFLSALNKFVRIQNDTANNIYDTRKKLPETIKYITKYKRLDKIIDDYFRFNNAAQIACESIYNIIKDTTGYTDHYVTVYRRYQDNTGRKCDVGCPLISSCPHKDDKKEWTKMVACYHKDSNKSLSLQQEHCFEYYESSNNVNSENRKKHFYIHFFSNNTTKIEIISGKKYIREKFLFHQSCIEREEKIEQYIGIPLYFSEDDLKTDLKHNSYNQQPITYAVLQIDFKEMGVLGKTDASIEELIQNVFSGIVAYLNAALQVEELSRNLFNNIIEISKLTNAIKKEQLSNQKKLRDDYNNLVREHNKLVCDYNNLLSKQSSK